jgi:hypothetical protein
VRAWGASGRVGSPKMRRFVWSGSLRPKEPRKITPGFTRRLESANCLAGKIRFRGLEIGFTLGLILPTRISLKGPLGMIRLGTGQMLCPIAMAR